MRYIKLFENFSLSKHIKIRENIESCLVELTDKGFEVSTYVDYKYINVEIVKDYNDYDALHNSEDFELCDIQDDVKQLTDYISETYHDKLLRVEYIPETRFNNNVYSKLEDIPDGLDLIRFDVYFYFENLGMFESFI